MDLSILSHGFITQSLGFVGCAIGAGAYLSHDDRQMKILYSAAELIFAIHFFMLGAVTAALMTFIVTIRTLCSLSSKLGRLYWFFMILHVVLGAYSYQNWGDILPILGSLIATHAFFRLEKMTMRLWLFPVSVLWIIHNIIKGSYGGIALETIYIVANAIHLKRTKRSQKNKS